MDNGLILSAMSITRS